MASLVVFILHILQMMMKSILGLSASLLLWSSPCLAQSVSLVDCEKVRCLTPQDERALRAQEQTLAQHKVTATSQSASASQLVASTSKSQLKNKSNSTTKSKSGTNTTSLKTSNASASSNASEVLNRDSMTLQEQQTYFAQNPWSFVLDVGAYRSLDELSDYYSTYSVSGQYQFKKNVFLSFSLGYDSILYSSFDKSFVFNGESSNPRLYGLTDLRLGVSLPGYIRLDEIQSIVTFSSRLTLPTSMRSRDKSLVAQLVSTAQMRTRLTPKLMSAVSASLVLAHFKYDDGDAMGYEVNSPLGTVLGASLSYNVWKKISMYGVFSAHARYDYDSNLDWIETVNAGVLFPIGDKIQMNLDYMWRDRAVTNDRLFDNNKSYYSLGLSYSI